MESEILYRVLVQYPGDSDDDWTTLEPAYRDKAAADVRAERVVSHLNGEFGEGEFSVRVVPSVEDE